MIQVSAHPEGKHYLALTKSGDVYSWGNGDAGQLGHGDAQSSDVPKLVQELSGRAVVYVAGKLIIWIFLSFVWYVKKIRSGTMILRFDDRCSRCWRCDLQICEWETLYDCIIVILILPYIR